jgi:hypothetical protein
MHKDYFGSQTIEMHYDGHFYCVNGNKKVDLIALKS